MRKTKKYAAFLVACVCLLVNLTGCQKVADEIVTSLVQWNLDSIYLNKHDETWLELVSSTQKQAEKDYLAGLEIEAEYFVNYWGIVDANYGESYSDLNQEFRTAVVDLFKEIYKHSKFKVQSAVAQDSKSYSVKVAVAPIDVMNQAYELAVNGEFEPLNAFYEKYTDVNIDEMTDEEYITYTYEYGNIILHLVHEQLPNLGYMETKTQNIQMESINGFWTINQDDLDIFDSYVIYYP